MVRAEGSTRIDGGALPLGTAAPRELHQREARLLLQPRVGHVSAHGRDHRLRRRASEHRLARLIVLSDVREGTWLGSRLGLGFG